MPSLKRKICNWRSMCIRVATGLLSATKHEEDGEEKNEKQLINSNNNRWSYDDRNRFSPC